MSKKEQISNKVVSDITPLVNQWRANGKRIVFTNGCFDILHRGHIEYLAGASDKADKFVVGVNSDESVRALDKGSARPIQDEESRALIVAALEFVDAVVIFEEDNPHQLISKVQPDVLVKGGDYDPQETNPEHKKYIVGSDIVRAKGGRVEVISFVPGYSTSQIEERIKKA